MINTITLRDVQEMTDEQLEELANSFKISVHVRNLVEDEIERRAYDYSDPSA